jgi:hypothetical protein
LLDSKGIQWLIYRSVDALKQFMPSYSGAWHWIQYSQCNAVCLQPEAITLVDLHVICRSTKDDPDREWEVENILNSHWRRRKADYESTRSGIGLLLRSLYVSSAMAEGYICLSKIFTTEHPNTLNPSRE